MNDATRGFLDHSRLHSMRRSLGPEAYLIIDRFAGGLPERIKHIAALMEPPGNTALEAEVHCMKGTAACCGFQKLAYMLEHSLLHGTGDFQELEACVRSSLDEWRTLHNTSPG